MSGVLSGAMGVLTDARRHISAGDPDAARFLVGVTAAGGTISPAAGAAYNAFIAGLKADGVWQNIVLIAPCIGDQLAAASVAYNAATSTVVNMVNAGYTAANYSVARGLVGDDTGSHFNTTLDIPSLATGDISYGAWVTYQPVNTTNYSCLIGASYSATGDTDRFYLFDTSPVNKSYGFGQFYAPFFAPTGPGWMFASYDNIAFTRYANTVVVATTTVSGVAWQKPGTVWIGGAAGGAAHTVSSLCMGLIAKAFTTAQNTAFYNRVVTLHAAIGRG